VPATCLLVALQAVAAPYATELLNLQDSRSRQTFILEQLQQQASDLGQAAAAMPLRVQRIESTMGLLESGDLKLRVRVLEAERAARRAGVLQVGGWLAGWLAGWVGGSVVLSWLNIGCLLYVCLPAC
jgi:hypothetical protein